ncbi:MAG TPA: MFS transporter [Actinoplanes sp.]|jgi:MFS family permease
MLKGLRSPVFRAGRPSLGAGYWRLWTAAGLSNLADGVAKVALPLVALRYTDSPTLIAGLAFTLMLPWLLFALPAGALADRLDRRRAMVAANVIRAGILAVLAAAVLADAGSLWLLYAVAFCIGTAETLYDTSSQSITPQIVGRELLSRANGRLFAAEFAANEFIGPPVGGFLVAAGVAAAFFAPAALWVVAVVVLLLVPGTFRVQRTRRTTMRGDIAEGLGFLWRHRVLRPLAAMVGLSNFANSAASAIFVLYAVGAGSALGLTEPAYGLLLSTTAAGCLLGFLIAESIERRLGRARGLLLAILGGALLIGCPALTDNPYLLGAGFFVGGSTIGVWNVITVSLRQRLTPAELMGRVNSVYRLLGWGTRPLGAAAGGLLAQAIGLRAVFAVMGVLALTAAAGMTQVTDAKLEAAERDVEHASRPTPKEPHERR